MSTLALFSSLCLSILALVSSSPFNPRPFDRLLSSRQISFNTSNDLIVDLGYERYQGVHNESTGLNTWKGCELSPNSNKNISCNVTLICKGMRLADSLLRCRIRYAAAPVGVLRWQVPQAPPVNRDEILRGDTLPQNCPQSLDTPLSVFLIS